VALRFLPDFGKAFLLDTVIGTKGLRDSSNALAEPEGVFGSVIRRLVLSRAWTFAEPAIAEEDLISPNFSVPIDQVAARDELAMDIAERLSGRDGHVVYYDPWSRPGDIGFDIFSGPNARLGVFEGHVFKVYDGRNYALARIDELITGVSYLKLIFVSSVKLASGLNDEAIFRTLLAGATYLYVNAYDDESWIGAGVEAIELTAS
jgi:hypothetical protein